MARSALVVAVALGLLACGYTFVDERAVFGPDLSSIQIQAFENRSTEPGYEQMLADALAEEFTRRGALRPVYDMRSADLILQGLIREVRVRPRSFSSVEIAVEDRVEVYLDVSIRRRGAGDTVWQREGFRFAELYPSSPDPGVYESNKEQALRRLASLISERIHDELVQSF